MIEIIEHEVNDNIPVSVNWHLWPYCNAKCTFCFATFRDVKGYLTKPEALKVLFLLKNAGTRKISFAGGEPLLCPYLPDLLIEAKKLGMTTMLITNGQKITKSWIEENAKLIDWLTISIDSDNEDTEIKLGRSKGNHVAHSKTIISCAKELGIHIKVNTVVTSLNWEEDMTSLIKEINPLRWKVFQVLPVKGQNDGINHLLITEKQFQHFLRNNKGCNPVSETNADMTSSYLMLDPLGRFFHNTERDQTGHLYSPSILSIGVNHALKLIHFNPKKLINRGGIYDWEMNRKNGGNDP